jgi:predicted transposase/invertase (TIGR01784 family)
MKNVFELVANDWRKEGLLEGKREKAFEIAAGMKAKGMSVETIAELTELTIDEILQL